MTQMLVVKSNKLDITKKHKYSNMINTKNSMKRKQMQQK